MNKAKSKRPRNSIKMQKRKKNRLKFNTSVPRFCQHLWMHKELIWKLSEREILGRYKGSTLGLIWSLITPLAMLAVYTFVFSQVFKAKWGGLEQTGPLGFAINLFAGLIVFNFFAECVSKSPALVINNQN